VLIVVLSHLVSTFRTRTARRRAARA
jgi:hypothetical protein